MWAAREENGFLRFIRMVRGIPKPVLIGLRGDVAFPFLALALAFDVRVVSGDTVFHNRRQELGMPPAGGLSCLLPLHVGFHKATQILTQTSKIDSRWAFSLGLVDQIVLPDDFEGEAISVGHEWARRPIEVIAAAKRGLNVHLLDPDVHFGAPPQAPWVLGPDHSQAGSPC